MRGVALITVAVALVAAGAAGAARTDSLPGTKTAADRAKWRAILHWPASCEEKWDVAMGAGIGTWRTSSDKRLVQVSCFLGAYQGTFMLYLVDAKRRATGPLVLVSYRDPGSGRPTLTRQKEILGVASFTPATGILTVLDKFRGVGDCGIYSTFRLKDDRFVPTEVRAKVACDGKPPYDARRWPKLPVPKGP